MQASVEQKLNKLLEEFRQGKRESSTICVQTVDTLTSNESFTWRTIREELEDVGTLGAWESNREFILVGFVRKANFCRYLSLFLIVSCAGSLANHAQSLIIPDVPALIGCLYILNFTKDRLSACQQVLRSIFINSASAFQLAPCRGPRRQHQTQQSRPLPRQQHLQITLTSHVKLSTETNQSVISALARQKHLALSSFKSLPAQRYSFHN